MSTTVTYKGSTLTTAENQTKILKTAGKYMEGDVTVTDVTSGGSSQAIITDTTDSAGGTIRTITTDEEIYLTSLSVTQNGTYNAPTTPNLTAYNSVTVNVSGGSSDISTATGNITITNGETVMITSDYSGNNAVVILDDTMNGSTDLSLPDGDNAFVLYKGHSKGSFMCEEEVTTYSGDITLNQIEDSDVWYCVFDITGDFSITLKAYQLM